MPHPSPSAVRPPRAERRDFTREVHGDRFSDPYAWMADREDPALLAYLQDENAYADQLTAHVGPLADQVYAELKSRIVETDLSVPTRHDRWWYYSRTVEGQQYPVEARVCVEDHPHRPALDHGQPPPSEQLLLDQNLDAAGHDFYAVGECEVSPDGSLLAWAVDVTGDERYDLRVRHLGSGETVDHSVTQTGGPVAWSLDGRFLFYTRLDEAWRPCQVWRHEVGQPAELDTLVHDEPDERFFVSVGASRDDRWVVISIASRTTSEVRVLSAADPEGKAWVFAPRQEGVEYDVEPLGELAYVVHNADRVNFSVSVAPLRPGSRADWAPLDISAPDEYVTGIDAFEHHLVVSLRRAGMSEIRVVDTVPDRPDQVLSRHDLTWDEPIHTVSVGANPDPHSQLVQLSYVSLVTPHTVLEYNLQTRERTVLKQQQVRGGHDPADYVQHLQWAQAPDGTRIPVSVVHHRDTPLDGTAPGYLYGYGAYGIAMEPEFSVIRLSLLQRGWVHATAHVRGGSERGRDWYEDGKLEHKQNTFTDFIACADWLRASGWIDPNRLAAEGGSAGGLLMGVVANQAPDRFRFIHAAVPFVDALTTMLDPELPLTVIEWDEWGDPVHDRAAYNRMKGYSPYENLGAQRYPTMLVTSSLHDTRVLVTEAAKYVAALRHVAGGIDDARPVILRTELAAGHGGRSGRYRLWRQAAWETAVMIDAVVTP